MTIRSIYLASKSPRRRELITNLGFDVIVIASNDFTRRAFEGDEMRHPNESPESYVERTARQKFSEGLIRRTEIAGCEKTPIIAADTVVSLGDEVLGKPRDTAEATDFLQRLSGATHEVRTTVVVGRSIDTTLTRTSLSLVTFKALSDAEIAAYIATDEPFDKAGGYGIQGLGGCFISHIAGSYTGIMGLPIFEFSEIMREFGLPPLHQ